MPFKPGQTKKGGRKRGTPNKLTKTVKESVFDVFNQLQDDPKHSLLAFAKKHPRDFYAIAAKLIPADMNVKSAMTIKVGYGDKN